MAIKQYKDGINKDTNVLGSNVYLGNGQSCGTIWFETVEQARKALNKDGIISGRDLFDCAKCSCHYSYNTSEHKKYFEFACRTAKAEYAKQFKKNGGETNDLR